jgi:multidrug efflux system outer membrane protein
MTLIPFPRLAPAAGLAMLLAGCTSLAPPPATPDPALPAHFDAAPSEPAGPAVGDDWQAFFTDARLQARIRQALAFNRDLRGAMLQVAEARAAYGIRRGEPLPAVGLGAGGMRERVPADLSLTRHTSYGTQYQAGLGIASWELDFWGRMASLEEAALQQYFASVEVRQAATLSLIAQVAQTHLLLQELDERLRLARRTVASRAESRRIVARRVEVGAASRLSLTQVDTLLNQAEVLAAQLEQARAQQAHAMRLLTGETEPAASDTPEAPLQLGSAPRAGLPSELLLRRPDLLAAAGLSKARVLVVSLDDRASANRLVAYARQMRPDLHIVARARDREHVFELYKAGANDIVREMFDSSLRAGRYVLENVGLSEF